MRKVRELLRLRFEQNLSLRQAAQAVGIGKTAAGDYAAGFRSSGLLYASITQMSDTELLNALSLKKETANQRYNDFTSLFPYIEKELKRTGVTLHLLWKEHKQDNHDGYGYSQFCHHYKQWRKHHKVSMRMDHKAGDKMFVDFTGKKASIVDPKTGEIIEYEVFVAVLGASQLAYIEAVPSQKKDDWISANQNALRFFGGVPNAIVPDCLKSAVIKSNKYEPQVNESYNDFASHYNTAILPARALHPQDKSLAESFVRHAYTDIYAPLRNTVFFSLEDLNQAFLQQLDCYNKKNFQKRDHSRLQLFKQIEESELKPLPAYNYELKTFKVCKAQYNHHIYLTEDKHYYSVPFQYTGKSLNVCYTARNIEVYFNNIRIAIHQRDIRPYGYTTNNDHRPETHNFVAQWSSERFLKWAGDISPIVQQLVQAIMDNRKHPEQAYKSCMGILQLSKKYDSQEYIKTCEKALKLNILKYKFIKNTLDNKTFNMDMEEELSLFSLPKHENIRGKEMYN